MEKTIGLEKSSQTFEEIQYNRTCIGFNAKYEGNLGNPANNVLASFGEMLSSR